MPSLVATTSTPTRKLRSHQFIKQLWMIWRMQIASIHLNDNIDDNTDFDQP